MRIMIILLSIALLFFSCKKEYHVVGKVYNPITGAGMSGVKIEFFKSTGGLPGGFEEVASTFSDGNGNYDLKFKGQAHSIQLDGSNELYELGSLQDGTYQKVLSLEHKKTQNIDWHVVQYGRYGLNVNNINCQGVNDTIIINQQNQVNSLLDYDWILTGCSGYTTDIEKVPMGNINVSWTVIRSGVETNFSDSFFIGAGQEVVYNLNY